MKHDFLVLLFTVVEEWGPVFKNRQEPDIFVLLEISVLQINNCHPCRFPHQVYTSVNDKDHKSKQQTRTKEACLSSLLVTQDTSSLPVSPGTPMTVPAIKAVHLQKGHPLGEACFIYQPACTDRERARLNSVANSCSEKQGQVTSEAQTVTAETASCSLLNSVQCASCFLFGSGLASFRGILTLLCWREKKSLGLVFGSIIILLM